MMYEEQDQADFDYIKWCIIFRVLLDFRVKLMRKRNRYCMLKRCFKHTAQTELSVHGLIRKAALPLLLTMIASRHFAEVMPRVRETLQRGYRSLALVI
ncbi:hypothetical protein Plhal304r1_c073g0161421 [Plasmopara halstedii]